MGPWGTPARPWYCWACIMFPPIPLFTCTQAGACVRERRTSRRHPECLFQSLFKRKL